MKKNNKLLWLLVIPVIVIAYFFIKGQTTQFIETNLYDANGNLIKQNALSVVNDVEGVSFVSFDINIENKDSVALSFLVKSITPTLADSKKPTNKITIEPGQKGTLKTGLIETEPFENKTQEFCVIVTNEAISGLRESQDKKGCISLDIRPNPQGEFDIIIDFDNQDGGINPGCTEAWICTDWNTCTGGLQTRTCTDSNSCGTTATKPTEQQSCSTSPQFSTTAINENFNVAGVLINLNSLQYSRQGISSYRCLPENIILRTPERNYPVCSRPSYDITSRVYIDDSSNGIIFSR